MEGDRVPSLLSLKAVESAKHEQPRLWAWDIGLCVYAGRSFSKNGLLLLLLTFVFAATFIVFCNDAVTVGSTYYARQNTVVVSATDRGQQSRCGNVTGSADTACVPPQTVIEHGCYRVTEGERPKFSLMGVSELTRRNCSRREPKAIIIGSKKSGTTTLKNFLSFHPEISFAQRELKFVNSNPLTNLDDYRDVMPFSTPQQLPMEKTPGYLIRTVTAERLHRRMPETKFIVILRDPVKRAISDYVHMRHVDDNSPNGAKLVRRGKLHLMSPRYELMNSFAESVLFPNGSVREYNCLVDSGIYVKYFRRWLELFPPDQFLVLDGEEFVKNPSPTISRVERFLGVKPYFTADHFYYAEEKRFYCLKKPLNTCMSKGKGRPHPEVSENTLATLRQYYHPHNIALEKLLNMTFSWP
ncbi:heparan sulfate glucosamine 3-O-sulfotransferase 1-like [Diadema antillarum]|uniref:heparan sulfate glucosamine 3-O-sulfotransferase 1-like n=1 Tax=Diadema antillarum TaxID=105358 RepID=UPI003A89F96F